MKDFETKNCLQLHLRAFLKIGDSNTLKKRNFFGENSAREESHRPFGRGLSNLLHSSQWIISSCEMRIGIISPVELRVPPVGYGGIEARNKYPHRRTSEPAEHDVTLFASGDSITSARLVSVVPEISQKIQTQDRDSFLTRT